MNPQEHLPTPGAQDPTLTGAAPHALLVGIEPRFPDEVALLKRESDALQADPELAEQYNAIVIEGDREALEAKSAAQLSHLQKMHTRQWGIFGASQAAEHLRSFEDMVQDMHPIRHDKTTSDVFLSPKQTESFNSTGGADDEIVRASEYVYATLDGPISHPMGGRKGAAHVHELDETDMSDRAEFVMNDVRDLGSMIQSRNTEAPESLIRTYLANTFDYQTGKKVLATYLALVFENPEEAASFFRNNHGDRAKFQAWDTNADRFHGPDLAQAPPADASREQWDAYSTQVDARKEDILQRMHYILKSTGLEPPFMPEVRVRDHAKVA